MKAVKEEVMVTLADTIMMGQIVAFEGSDSSHAKLDYYLLKAAGPGEVLQADEVDQASGATFKAGDHIVRGEWLIPMSTESRVFALWNPGQQAIVHAHSLRALHLDAEEAALEVSEEMVLRMADDDDFPLQVIGQLRQAQRAGRPLECWEVSVQAHEAIINKCALLQL